MKKDHTEIVQQRKGHKIDRQATDAMPSPFKQTSLCTFFKTSASSSFCRCIICCNLPKSPALHLSETNIGNSSGKKYLHGKILSRFTYFQHSLGLFYYCKGRSPIIHRRRSKGFLEFVCHCLPSRFHYCKFQNLRIFLKHG